MKVFRIISPQIKQNNLTSATSPFKRGASHLLVMWLLLRKTPREVCVIVKAGPGLIQMGKILTKITQLLYLLMKL